MNTTGFSPAKGEPWNSKTPSGTATATTATTAAKWYVCRNTVESSWAMAPMSIRRHGTERPAASSPSTSKEISSSLEVQRSEPMGEDFAAWGMVGFTVVRWDIEVKDMKVVTAASVPIESVVAAVAATGVRMAPVAVVVVMREPAVPAPVATVAPAAAGALGEAVNQELGSPMTE